MREDTIKIGGRTFLRRGKTYICGILNVTPDSFSDGGKWIGQDAALRHVEEMLRDGMDILDIGGESTRPGAAAISEEEEITRVIPMIENIKSRFNVPISLDTYKNGVARAGIDAGADMINDVRGLRRDADMAETIARSGVPCCLMHNRTVADSARRIGNPGEIPGVGRSDGDAEAGGEVDIIDIVRDDLAETLRLAEQAGIDRGKIILDPGVGFGKTVEQNLRLVGGLERLLDLGCPMLLGCSRKSFIGETLGLPVDERLEGTLAATVFAVVKGASFVRVHDVKENARAARMAEAILYG